MVGKAWTFSHLRYEGFERMGTHQELVEHVFETALLLEPDKRAAYLGEVCADNLELRRTVQDLLDQDANAGSFLEHPPFDFFNSALVCSPAAVDTADSIGDAVISAASPAPGRLKVGSILIDRFVIVRFIAKGGMGEVYEAEDGFLQGVHVALKTILPEIADDPAFRQRFEREVLLAREVNHPNLCPIYDIFHCQEPAPDFLFLTMKLLPGETLAARLRSTTPIPFAEGLAILKQMAAGLAAIHSAGVVHRDIKPNNIMLDGTGSNVRLYVTDFGLARAHEAEPSLSSKGLIAGTPDYMAPELYLGQTPSQATDLYAFGVVLHQVFTGQKPVVSPDGGSVTIHSRLNTSGLRPFCVQLIVECLNRDPKRRCQAFESALDLLDVSHRPAFRWTRRQFAGAAVGAFCCIAGGAWWQWDQVEDLLRPLPRKRFVALLNWPQTSNNQLIPMLTSVLTAIKSELTRFETLDSNLFVISPEDANMSVTGMTHLKEVCDPLGANLALAASAVPGAKDFQLVLRVLDPITSQPLREKKLACARAEITSLPGKAVHAAATLLDLTSYSRSDAAAKPATQSAAAFSAFQSAEANFKQTDRATLEAAIDGYKQAIELDPRYALAYAKLAQAYANFSATQRNPAALTLARSNCDVALRLDPNLVDAHLALALIFQFSGKEQEALDELSRTLLLDPSNPKPLVWQAQIYWRLSRWDEHQKILERVLKEHPNNWPAYNQLGAGLHEQGKFQQAIEAFRVATLVAPKSPMAWNNLGSEYMEVGQFAEGMESSRRGLALDPTSDYAAANLARALRSQGKYEAALPFARKAVEFNPALDTNWLELGDCYSSLRNHQADAKSAYMRADQEAERHLLTDPSDGQTVMLLALYQVKSGRPQNALSLIQKAESLGAHDLDSQLSKTRVLELLGKREQALTTLAACFQKGATDLQLLPFPELQSLRKDPNYERMRRVRR
jgi:eukaryotic-like serine/threonine-protein kinase